MTGTATNATRPVQLQSERGFLLFKKLGHLLGVKFMTIEEFEVYHFQNPQIYQAFERFTFEAINANRRHFGAGAVIERIRWFTNVRFAFAVNTSRHGSGVPVR